MPGFFAWLFSSRGFMPHGHCYLWQADTLWLNVGSDAMIAGSYYAIPVALFYIVRERRLDLPYPWLLSMFAAFILLCGSTHVMEVWTVWQPDYRLAGALKFLTALISVATAIALIRIMPRLLLLRTSMQLQQQVDVRTTELSQTNIMLRAEIAAKHLAELQLQQADRRKDEFLAILAHELRNPLTPVRNAIEILKLKGSQDTAVRRPLEILDRQTRHMARLIDELMDVSRITTGQINLKNERTDLTRIIKDTVEACRSMIEGAQHTFTMQLPAEPLYVEGDTLRLSQVLQNLLSNAVKYTPANGQLNLHVERQAGDAVIRLRDNGAGIPPEMLTEIFEMFRQGPHTNPLNPGGLGIGLALARELAELHHGSLTVQSEGEGRGSEFILRLPTSA